MNAHAQHNVRIIDKDDLDIERIRAEITSLLESSRKMRVERQWHPIWVGAAIFAAGATLAKIFM